MRVSHDQLVKEVGLAFPADLVTLTLPYLARQIDLEALDFETSRERFDDILRGRRWFPDLASEVRCRSGPEEHALAHLEIEYEYRSRKLPVLREYNRVLSKGTGLLVHTAVIYLHGGPPGLVRNKQQDVSFGRDLWTFRYNSLGLSRAPAWKYLKRPQPLAWAFAVLMHPQGFASRGELAIACVRRILGARKLDEDRRFKLLNFVQTYVKLDDRTAPEYEALLRESENQEVREMFMTWADEIREEGREEGLRQGEASLLERQLNRRFVELPKWVLERLEQATREELGRWSERVLEARRLEDVFSSP